MCETKFLLKFMLNFGTDDLIETDLGSLCYKVMQVFMVTVLFAGQHNTKLHGTFTDVLYKYNSFDLLQTITIVYSWE